MMLPVTCVGYLQVQTNLGAHLAQRPTCKALYAPAKAEVPAPQLPASVEDHRARSHQAVVSNGLSSLRYDKDLEGSEIQSIKHFITLYHYTASFTRGYTEYSIFSILTV